MKIQHIVPALVLMATGSAFASDNYYGALRIGSAKNKAHDMDSSARPGLGQFVRGDDTNDTTSGSLALGYRFAPEWRVEAEYTLPRHNEFTSGSTNFPTSFNHHKIRSQRLMVNAYRDVPLNAQFSVYATAGLGLARLQSSGWQGNPNRQYVDGSDNNLAYAVGFGVTYSPAQKVSIDLGYRYTDMGKARSGANNFTNVRGLRDEQMRAKLTSSEISVGVRYSF